MKCARVYGFETTLGSVEGSGLAVWSFQGLRSVVAARPPRRFFDIPSGFEVEGFCDGGFQSCISSLELGAESLCTALGGQILPEANLKRKEKIESRSGCGADMKREGCVAAQNLGRRNKGWELGLGFRAGI